MLTLLSDNTIPVAEPPPPHKAEKLIHLIVYYASFRSLAHS